MVLSGSGSLLLPHYPCYTLRLTGVACVTASASDLAGLKRARDDASEPLDDDGSDEETEGESADDVDGTLASGVLV